jgi:hypothetical protein
VVHTLTTSLLKGLKDNSKLQAVMESWSNNHHNRDAAENREYHKQMPQQPVTLNPPSIKFIQIYLKIPGASIKTNRLTTLWETGDVNTQIDHSSAYCLGYGLQTKETGF